MGNNHRVDTRNNLYSGGTLFNMANVKKFVMATILFLILCFVGNTLYGICAYYKASRSLELSAFYRGLAVDYYEVGDSTFNYYWALADSYYVIYKEFYDD